MRKQAIFSLFFVATLWLTAGFGTQAQGIMAGLRGGLNLTGLSHSAAQLEGATRFSGGLFVNVASDDLFSVQPEFNFVWHSAGARGTNINLTYFEVPILFRLSTGYSTRFYANAGPVISTLLRARESGALLASDASFVAQESDRRDVSRFDRDSNFGLMGGVGVIINNIMVEARYTLGLSDISRVQGQSISTSDLNINVGYCLFF